MDFTFEIGHFFYLLPLSKSAPYYSRAVLVAFSNWSSYMLCYKKTEKAVKVFFDAISEQLPGLKLYMKAIDADGEKSLIQAACDSFPTAVSLSCLLHAKKNIKRKLVEGLRMNEEEFKQIFEDLFGSSFQTGLIEIDQADQFEGCAQALIDKWKHGSKKQVAFAEYFETYEKEQLKYHVSKNAVSSAGIIDTSNGKFFNNTSESMNKLIKDWQERKKLDCVRFAEEFEDLILQQESYIMRTFSRVSSPYII